MTKPIVTNPQDVSVSTLERIRHANEAVVCWLRDNPAESVGTGIAACAAGAGLIFVAPPLLAMGASMVAMGMGVATVGGWLAVGGVLIGAVGQSAETVRSGLMLGTAVIVGGGAIAGAGIALQAAGVITATGGGALIAGGAVATTYGAYRLIRGHQDRPLRQLVPNVQQQLQETGHDPQKAPQVVFDLSQINNPI